MTACPGWPCVHPILQLANGIAHARLGDVEVSGGAHEAQALRHLHEDRQRPQSCIATHITDGDELDYHIADYSAVLSPDIVSGVESYGSIRRVPAAARPNMPMLIAGCLYIVFRSLL